MGGPRRVSRPAVRPDRRRDVPPSDALGQRNAVHQASIGCPYTCNFCGVIAAFGSLEKFAAPARTARVLATLVHEPRRRRGPLLRQQLLSEGGPRPGALRAAHAPRPALVVRGADRRDDPLLRRDVGSDPARRLLDDLLRRRVGLGRNAPEDVEEPDDGRDARARGEGEVVRHRPGVLVRLRRPGRSRRREPRRRSPSSGSSGASTRR